MNKDTSTSKVIKYTLPGSQSPAIELIEPNVESHIYTNHLNGKKKQGIDAFVVSNR